MVNWTGDSMIEYTEAFTNINIIKWKIGESYILAVNIWAYQNCAFSEDQSSTKILKPLQSYSLRRVVSVHHLQLIILEKVVSVFALR